MDINDADYTDILLATMYQLAVHAKDAGYRFNEAHVTNLNKRLAQITIEDVETESAQIEAEAGVEAGAGFLSMIRVMAKLKTALRSGAERKEKVRTEIRRRLAEFLDDLNDLINRFQSQLRAEHESGLVIIIDSLDRIIPRIVDERTGGTKHTQIFIDHADHLKAPRCHIVYTIPISLQANANLNTVYSERTVTLPMVKVREEGGDPCDEAIDALEKAVAKRMDVAALFERPEDVRILCTFSGGHIRDLMHLLRYACDYSDDRITSHAVGRAREALVRDYDRLVKEKDVSRLVEVHETRWLPPDEEYALLPYHLLVLEYQNGNRWADVHPAVQQTRKFLEAVKNG